MMPDEIKGRDALRRWLYAQSHEVAVAIAHRAAMRVAPSFWFVASRGHGESDLTALATTRSLLTSGVAAACPTPEVKAAAGASSSVDTASADASADAAAFAAIAAARSAATYSPGAAADAAAFAATAATARAFATRVVAAGAAADTAAWNAVRYDASILNSLETGRAIFALPLRSEAANPLDDDWGTVRAAWSAAGPGWQFWIDWYEAALEGRPLLGDWDRHWDLLTEIALIPDADWTAGPDRLNALIELIVEKHRLKAEAARLRAELVRHEAAFASVAHRSHNQPPELVEVPIVHQYRVAIGALAEVEEELAKPSPSPSRLVRVAETLRDWAGKTLMYCAKLGDAALMELAKGVGKVAAPGAAVWLLAQSEHAQTLAHALMDFAARLPGGLP